MGARLTAQEALGLAETLALGPASMASTPDERDRLGLAVQLSILHELRRLNAILESARDEATQREARVTPDGEE